MLYWIFLSYAKDRILQMLLKYYVQALMTKPETFRCVTVLASLASRQQIQTRVLASLDITVYSAITPVQAVPTLRVTTMVSAAWMVYVDVCGTGMEMGSVLVVQTQQMLG